MLNWLKKERCKICSDERGIRYCLRRNKDIGWKCCNSYRSDGKCPAPCVYTPKYDDTTPLPRIKSDSQTEFIGFVTQYLQFWIYKPQQALNDASPIQLSETQEGREKLVKWLSGFSYPDADIIKALNAKLSITLPKLQHQDSVESIAGRYLDLVISQDWDMLLGYHSLMLNQNAETKNLFTTGLSQHPLLKKTRNWEIINSGISEDGKQAFAFYELNGKESWTFVFHRENDKWIINQQIWGTMQDYYAQKDLFRSIAIAINQNQESIAYNLLNQANNRYLLCADLQYYWGLCYLLSKRIDDAKISFIKALAFEPTWLEPKFRLGLIEMNEKNYDAAITIWKSILESNPTEVNALNNLGICWLGLEQFDKAKEAWHNALKIDPNSELARKNLEHIDGQA